MKAQTKALVASVVVIALALSAVSGITYSWFSDTEQSEVVVTTAVVDLDPQYEVAGTSSIGTTLTKGDITGGVQSFTLSNLAANQHFTIISEITNKSTVKTVYRMYATYDKTGSDMTDYDIQNISINGAYFTSEKGTTANPLVITDWKTLEKGISPSPSSIVVATPTTYGDYKTNGDGTLSAGYVLPDGTLYSGDWNAQTARSGLTIDIIIEAYQGDYPYTEMTEIDGSDAVSATIPANKVVKADSITSSESGSTATVTDVVMDFSDAGTYTASGSSDAEEITGTIIKTEVTGISTTSETTNVSIKLSLYKSGEDSPITSPKFTNPVVITMTVPGALSDPKVVYNETGTDGTVLSSTINGSGADATTTVVFSVDHFSDYTIKQDNGAESKWELQKALSAGGYVKLGSDISDVSVDIKITSDATLDLNGHTITFTSQNDDSSNWNIVIQEGAKLSVVGADGSAITFSKTWGFRTFGTLTIDGDAVFTGAQIDDSVIVGTRGEGAQITIDGGTFNAHSSGVAVYAWQGPVTINDGQFSGTTTESKYGWLLNQYNTLPGTITVYGGTYTGYDPSKGDNVLGGSFVAEGYAVSSSNDTSGNTVYTVDSPYVSLTIGGTTTFYMTVDEVVAALNADATGGDAKLEFLQDYTAVTPSKLEITKPVNISSDSKVAVTNVVWIVKASGTVGFSNLKFITNTGKQDWQHIITIDAENSADVSVLGCDFVSGCTYTNSSSGAIWAISGNSGSLSVSDSTFALGDLTMDARRHALELDSLKSVTLNGNTFTNISRPVNIKSVSSVTSSGNTFDMTAISGTTKQKVYNLNTGVQMVSITGDTIHWNEVGGKERYEVYINESVEITGTFETDKNVTVESGSGICFTINKTAQIGGSLTAGGGQVKLGAVGSSIETSNDITAMLVSGVSGYDAVCEKQTSGTYRSSLSSSTSG